ncbi:MAG: hypothetical protein AAB875_00260 [Patescibacteria group bacterium]
MAKYKGDIEMNTCKECGQSVKDEIIQELYLCFLDGTGKIICRKRLEESIEKIAMGIEHFKVPNVVDRYTALVGYIGDFSLCKSFDTFEGAVDYLQNCDPKFRFFKTNA